jgi:diguanylate cyclase (GGDEF)-like protein
MIYQRRKSDLNKGKSEAHREWPTIARQKEKRAVLLEKSRRGIAVFDTDLRLIDCNSLYGDAHDLPPSLMREGAALLDVLNHMVETGDLPGNDADAYVTKHINLAKSNSIETVFETLPDGRVMSVGYIPVETGGCIITQDDVSNIFAVKEEIEHAGFYDRRTTLPNKRVLLKCIDEAYMQSWDESSFALFVVKATNFASLQERLEDTAGHLLIKQIGDRIRDCIRQGDLPAKLDGAEFGILQQAVSQLADSEALVKRLLDDLNQPYMIEGMPVLVEFSVGIALPNTEDDREETLVQNARDAADTATQQVGCRYAFCNVKEEELALSA